MSGRDGRPEGSFYEPLVWSVSAFLVFSGLVLTILMWTHVIGPFRFGLLAPGAGRAPSGAVGLWVPHTPALEMPSETARRLDRWRRLLPEGRPVVADRSLEALARAGAGVVVVPDARSLGPAELEALDAFATAGGGVIVPGPVAVRGPDGRWRGTDAMARWLGVPGVHALPAGSSHRVRAGVRGPLAAALGPRESVRLTPEPGAPALAHGGAELRWDAEGDGPDGASLRLGRGRGRVVWLGAGPERAWMAEDAAWTPMARLVRAALAWVSRRPLPELLPGALAGAEDPARSASPAELARWAALRDEIAVSVETAGPRRLRVDVTNLGERAWDDLTLRLHLNRPTDALEVGGTTLAQAPPALRWRPGGERADLDLPPLPAGASRAWTLDLGPEPGDPPRAAAGGRAPESPPAAGT